MNQEIITKKLTELPVVTSATQNAKSLISQSDSNGVEKLYRINYNNTPTSFQPFTIVYDDVNNKATVTFADNTVRYITYTLSESGKITSLSVTNTTPEED